MKSKWTYCLAAGMVAVAGACLPAAAAPFKVLHMGDSLTYGAGTSETEAAGGHRLYLDQLLSDSPYFGDFQFTGGLQDPDGTEPHWHNHYGVRAIEADGGGEIDFTGANSPGVNSLVERLDDPSYDVFGGHAPDTVLLNIGTNTIYDYTHRNEDDGVEDTAVEASEQLGRLLETLDTHLTSLGSNATVHVARIMPVAWDLLNDDYSTYDNIHNSIRYNYGEYDGSPNPSGLGIDEVIAGLSSAAASRVQLVDLFRIPTATLDWTLLTDPATGESIADAERFAELVDPDDDGYVDWILDFDEANLTGLTESTTYNDWLKTDGVHMHQIGYQIVAQTWYHAIVPEPSSAAILAAGVLLLAGRPRRSPRSSVSATVEAPSA